MYNIDTWTQHQQGCCKHLTSIHNNSNTNNNNNNNESSTYELTVQEDNNGIEDTVYIFESDTSTISKNKGGGVQLVPFHFWIQQFAAQYIPSEYYVVVRRLHFNGKRMTKAAIVSVKYFTYISHTSVLLLLLFTFFYYHVLSQHRIFLNLKNV